MSGTGLDTTDVVLAAVESIAFARVARWTFHGLPGSQPSVTDARRACIRGTVYAV